MGQPKLLLPWGDVTILQHVLGVWRASQVDRIVVVAHRDDQAVHACCRQVDVDLVIPEPPPAEMKDSVAAGLAWVQSRYSPSAEDAWMLAPADMPQLSATLIDHLIAEHRRREQSAILAPTYGGKRGHPALFPWPTAAEVFQLTEDEGVNVVVERHEVCELPCDEEGVLNDIDTPDDYRNLHDR